MIDRALIFTTTKHGADSGARLDQEVVVVPRGGVWQVRRLKELWLPTRSKLFIELKYLSASFPNPPSGSDLAHVTAAIRIFAVRTVRRTFPATWTPTACLNGASLGPSVAPDTKQLALALMKAKGLIWLMPCSPRLSAGRHIHSLRMQKKRGRVKREGKRKRQRVAVAIAAAMGLRDRSRNGPRGPANI